MTTDAEALELVDRMRDPAKRIPEVVDQYYTFCIPIYREFLGDHWHTGYYLFDDRPIGPQDQLRMERRIAKSAELSPDCLVRDWRSGLLSCRIFRRAHSRTDAQCCTVAMGPQACHECERY